MLISSELEILSREDVSKVIILHTEDFAVVSKLNNVHVAVVFCPYLYHYVRKLAPGLRVVFPLAATSDGADLWRVSEDRARQASDYLGKVSFGELQAGELQHWQFDYFNFLTLYALRWNEIAAKFAKLTLAGTFYIPMQDRPWRYGFYSFIPSSCLSFYIKSLVSIVPIHYHSDESREINVVPTFASLVDLEFDKLYYLPATQRHRSDLQCLVDLHPGAVIQAPYYDVPYQSTHIIRSLPVGADKLNSISANFLRSGVDLAKLFRSLIEALLAGIPLSDMQLAQQSTLLETDFVSQVLLLNNLRGTFEHSQLRYLCISMHLTPWHGPLLSFAIERKLDIEVMPHSYVQGMPFPISGSFSFCAHPIQDYFWDRYHQMWRRVTHWGGQSLTAPVNMSDIDDTDDLNSILIVLNGCGWSHTCLINMRQYIEDLDQLVSALMKMSISFDVRGKPDANFTSLIGDLIPKLSSSMERCTGAILDDILPSYDLVICFDSQSSLAIRALDIGIGVVFVRSASKDPTMDLCYFDQALIEYYDLDDLIRQVNNWKNNVESYQKFRKFQRLNYLTKVSAVIDN